MTFFYFYWYNLYKVGKERYILDRNNTKGGSAMANTKQTSARAASAASKVLRDGRTSKTSKTAAGSALSQTPSKKKTK